MIRHDDNNDNDDSDADNDGYDDDGDNDDGNDDYNYDNYDNYDNDGVAVSHLVSQAEIRRRMPSVHNSEVVSYRFLSSASFSSLNRLDCNHNYHDYIHSTAKSSATGFCLRHHQHPSKS